MTRFPVRKYAGVMRLAGHILDIYDDPKATVLLEKLAGRPLPEKLANSRVLSATELAALPDRLFAVVATNGEDVVRKYAMHDEPHLVTSLLYFLERGDTLPEEVQKVAATRLLEACGWYDVKPPQALTEKLAFLTQAFSAMKGVAAGAKGIGGALMKGYDVASNAIAAKGVYDTARAGMRTARQDFRNGTLTKAAAAEVFDNKAQANLERDEEQRVQRGGHLRVVPDADAKSVTQFSQMEERAAQKTKTTPGALQRVLDNLGALGSEKKSDLNGTDVMPMGALKVPTAGKNLLRMATKTASLTLDGHETPAVVVTQTYEVYALPHAQQYPIDTPELVKKAERYFDEHVHAFTPFERRVFAQSVWDRSHELGTKVAGHLLNYAGDGYGPNIASELIARADRLAGTGHETIYETLLEKCASIDPMVMASLLAEADEATGIAATYGRPVTGCLDPFAAVYGVKTAAEDKSIKDSNYSWKDGTEYVTGMQLINLAKRGPGQFDAHFGDSFGADFIKDPVGIFKSMPDPQKVLIVRLMNSPSVAGAGDI